MTIPAHAATSIPFTINMSEVVNITGTPRIPVDVGGTTRYATYTAGTGTNTLTFTYAATAGDVDLDGVTLVSPIDLNGGTIKDTNGNDATLTYTLPNTSNVKINYPSLSMDFVYDSDRRYTLGNNVYNDLTTFLAAASGSFTRASIGTYFDSSGTLQTAASGIPRFDYAPTTHAAKGLLIEEQRVNLLPRSSETENATWAKGNINTTANTATAPDGTISADVIIPNTTNNWHVLYQTYAFGSTTYTASAYFKSAGYRYGVISYNAALSAAVFDLQNGTIASGTGATITSVGNGWYRCTLTATTAGSTTQIEYSTTPNATWNIFTGDGTSGAYIWGIQMEAGSFATSYIPTTSATVTRSSDQLNVATASIPSWSTTVGTWTAEYYRPNNPAGTPFIVYSSGGAEFITDRSATVGTWNGSSEANVAGNPNIRKVASSFDASGRYISLNSAINTGAGTFSFASDNRIYFAGSSGGGRNPHSQISKIKYYPARIANTQLQLLTQ